ncbi:MAG TPA: ORF6N domain-containing protein [Gammaproteobacteria bacterium]
MRLDMPPTRAAAVLSTPSTCARAPVTAVVTEDRTFKGPLARRFASTHADPSRARAHRSRTPDRDLAALYGVETRVLVQAVKRNAGRFPDACVFWLSEDELAVLRSRSVILKKGRGKHAKFLPYAFTEHGALQTLARGGLQLSGILASVRTMASETVAAEGPMEARIARLSL